VWCIATTLMAWWRGPCYSVFASHSAPLRGFLVVNKLSWLFPGPATPHTPAGLFFESADNGRSWQGVSALPMAGRRAPNSADEHTLGLLLALSGEGAREAVVGRAGGEEASSLISRVFVWRIEK